MATVFATAFRADLSIFLSIFESLILFMFPQSKDKFLSAASSGFGFCSVVLFVDSVSFLASSECSFSGWDIHDSVYSRELLISNRTNGYHDILATVDFSSYRRVPWENNVPFFL